MLPDFRPAVMSVSGSYSPPVPEDHLSRAILTYGDCTLEAAVFQRVIFHLNCEALISGIH